MDGNGRGKVPTPNNNETIDYWMRTPLNLTHLYYDKLPVSPYCRRHACSLLRVLEFKCVSPTDAAENHNGYEYIRDHLGYRLELQSADWPTELSLPAKLNFSAMLLNWGFAAPVNPRPVHAVILSADKATVLWCSPSLADPRDWQPHIPGDPFYTPTRHAFGGSELAVTAADLADGCKSSKRCRLPIGLFMPDMRAGNIDAAEVSAAYSVRLANAGVGWSVVRGAAKSAHGGVNVLGEIAVSLP